MRLLKKGAAIGNTGWASYLFLYKFLQNSFESLSLSRSLSFSLPVLPFLSVSLPRVLSSLKPMARYCHLLSPCHELNNSIPNALARQWKQAVSITLRWFNTGNAVFQRSHKGCVCMCVCLLIFVKACMCHNRVMYLIQLSCMNVLIYCTYTRWLTEPHYENRHACMRIYMRYNLEHSLAVLRCSCDM